MEEGEKETAIKYIITRVLHAAPSERERNSMHFNLSQLILCSRRKNFQFIISWCEKGHTLATTSCIFLNSWQVARNSANAQKYGCLCVRFRISVIKYSKAKL